MRAILTRIDAGILIEASKITLSEYLDDWLSTVAPQTVAPKSLERYRGLVKKQIKPRLGSITLQKLRPADISQWLNELVAAGVLSTRSIRHAHGVLRTVLNHAAAIEIVERNVASIIRPPALVRKEIEILTADQIADALTKLEGHSIYPVAAIAIGTGARCGEIAALRWSDIDLDAATVRIERALEQTKGGIRVKAPKTAAGRRTISLPSFTVAAIREHRVKALEIRMALGAGALPDEAYIFGDVEGNPPNPYSMSDRWRDAVKYRKLPKVTFHALRHSHASALISAGLDVVAVSKRLGHASPSLTLSVYGHLFKTDDSDAGRWTCLLGPTGVGKTSLLRLFAGLAAADGDRVVTCGDGEPIAGRVAYMAQQDLLMPWLTVIENVVIGSRLRGARPAYERARELLDSVGLADRADDYPRVLSGGMRQRTALIRTLMEDRPIVLMDEPFSALDAITRLRLQSLAAELLRGRTVLLVTHDPLEALRLGDRIHVMAGSPARLDEAMTPAGATPRDPADRALLVLQAELLARLAAADGGEG